jgi:hypothetical protein
MLRIEPRLAFINGFLLANRTLIFRFQLLAVYVLLVHNCGECRIAIKSESTVKFLRDPRHGKPAKQIFGLSKLSQGNFQFCKIHSSNIIFVSAASSEA